MNKGVVILLIVAIGAVAFIAYDKGLLSPGLQIPAPPENGNGDIPSNGNGDMPSNSKAPTAMTALISPNPVTMGGVIYAVLSTDGYNYSPVNNYAKHKGSEEQTYVPGTIGPDGKYEIATTLNTPGYWEMWSECAGVTSNKVSLTCRGVLVVIDLEHWSKTLGPDSTEIEIYSNYQGNCAIYASHDGWATETYITNTVINSGGYGIVSQNFDSLAYGHWEFDARIGGYTAISYAGSDWVQVGR